jgi:DNA-binding protein HU-beta
MGKGMTKNQIASHFAEKFGLKKKVVNEFFEELAALAYKESVNQFTIPGIGKLVLVDRKARVGRNPATGETIQIPAKKVVKFKVAKAAKDEILKKFT